MKCTHRNLQVKIVAILRNAGSKESLLKAKLLEAPDYTSSSLHLRNLNLKSADVVKIASILKNITTNGSHIINSISLSYNSSLSDAGAVALANALPFSIRELGLVNCGIGEEGGRAILDWIRKAPNLQMVRIEQNKFSEKLTIDLQKFKVENPKIMVVI